MEKGTIPKLLNYYFENPEFREDILRAFRSFFNRPQLFFGDKLEKDEKNEEMFNEWFVFDFKLSNNRTPLEDFYETNPYNLNMVQLQIYKDLQDNHFGFYEVKDVKLGEGLTLENLQTGKVYQVREYSATFGLKEGQVFSARVGKVGDHYELVGSNPSFGPVRINPALRNLFSKNKDKLNPKILRDSFSGDRKTASSLKEFSSLEEAEDDLKKVLAKYDLEKFVSVETIKEWIYNRSGDDPFTFELSILCGLLYPDREDYNQALTEILNSFNPFYNLCPQKELGGKSPFQKREESEQKGVPPDLEMSLNKFSPSGWGKKYSKALQHMKQGEFKRALKKFNEVFAYLLEHRTTYPEIYRIYANKGVCHFSLGEGKIGEFMLKISNELNCFYDFAKRQLERYRNGEYNFSSVKKKIKLYIAQDVGYQYYQFLKPLKINFSHPLKEPPAIVNISRGKGRN